MSLSHLQNFQTDPSQPGYPLKQGRCFGRTVQIAIVRGRGGPSLAFRSMGGAETRPPWLLCTSWKGEGDGGLDRHHPGQAVE